MTTPSDDWMRAAACRDHPNPSLWFPSRGGTFQTAVKVCRSCPVRQECHDFAVALNYHDGIWGGVSFSREAVRSVRRKQAQLH